MRRIIIFLFIAAILTIIAVFVRFEWFAQALQDEEEFTPGQANAAKHAYASAQLYSTLRTFVPPYAAEHAVIRLGYLNERMERITKFNNPDSTNEIVKDLHNNLAGTMAAEWAIWHKRPRLNVVLTLIRHEGLITSSDFPRSEKNDTGNPTRDAIVWFESEEPALRAYIKAALAEIESDEVLPNYVDPNAIDFER